MVYINHPNNTQALHLLVAEVVSEELKSYIFNPRPCYLVFKKKKIRIFYIYILNLCYHSSVNLRFKFVSRINKSQNMLSVQIRNQEVTRKYQIGIE